MLDHATERSLKAELAARHQRAKRGLHEISREMTQVTVPVVLREFDPRALVDGAVRFAAGLSREQSDSWFRCYTRTVFLFGNPRNLAARYPVRARAGDDAAGWLGVLDVKELVPLRRLLRPVTGTLPAVKVTDAGTPGGTAAAGAPWSLWLAIRDLDLAQYLVHLHHTVAEAVLTGKMNPGQAINLRHVTDLHPSRLEQPDCVYSRVHHRPGNPDRLRLYALLSRTG